jgi:hypothetical protein
VEYNELLTATVTAQDAHFPEILRLLSALAFLYGNCFHLQSISDCGPLRSFDFTVRAFAAAFEALIALSRRCFAVKALARAWPPRLPI